MSHRLPPCDHDGCPPTHCKRVAHSLRQLEGKDIKPNLKRKPEPPIGGSLEPVGSGRCCDCCTVLTAANRTNRDNVLGNPICDRCRDERWGDFMADEQTSNDRGQARREKQETTE